jgi:DNA-binding PadR family transcriptional regulator
MTPNSIEVLIHCHCSPRQHPRFDAPAIKDALSDLEANGLIVKTTSADRNVYDDGTYKTTDRGAAHIEQLCQTPYPVELWCTVHGEVISPNKSLHATQKDGQEK